MLFSVTYFSFSKLETQTCHKHINILSFDGLSHYAYFSDNPSHNYIKILFRS